MRNKWKVCSGLSLLVALGFLVDALFSSSADSYLSASMFFFILALVLFLNDRYENQTQAQLYKKDKINI